MVKLEILEKKFKALGFTHNTIAWFKSFSESRNIETVLNGVKSDKIEMRRELSEGSSLSATLYLIATIDVNEYTKYSYNKGFMDDFVITSAIKDLKVALENAQEDFQNMIKYFTINKMAIKTDKTALMVIKPNNIAVKPVKIKIDDEVTCQQESIKMLGEVFDEK